ncbi:MAG TPA: M48 family metalloprotease [Allosphingosinicella sp.]|jgi:Zn-dependent protease with chaperone function
MAVHGYVTHAARNRRFTWWLVAAYVAAFQLLGVFASALFVLALDHRNFIVANPGGYAIRYGLPIALLSLFLFWRMYRGHAGFVTGVLGIRPVTRSEEPRFVAIAEEQCTALGVRLPRFGIIEAEEPNALTVGEGPAAGLIAVTRGLLARLDDDELAAVLAHEASHIRMGDTKILAANHALMRTAILFQTHNPLRLEDWRQMIIPLLLPPMLLVMLAGTAATSASMGLARLARRGLKLGRDHIADGEAVRVTHYPEALIDALLKIGGRGAFEGSYAVEGLLFDAPPDRDGGRRSPIADRVAAIASLGAGLMDPGRLRRDTRTRAPAPRATFGRNYAAAAAAAPPPCRFARDAVGRPLQEPPTPTLNMLLLYFTDRATFWKWQHACIAWQEWRSEDRRNALGLTPRMIIPVAATAMFLLVFHWPADNDLSKLRATFDPAAFMEMAEMMDATSTFCSGSTCESSNAVSVETRPAAQASPAPAPADGLRQAAGGPADFGTLMLPFLVTFLLLLVFRYPNLLRWLFGIRR